MNKEIIVVYQDCYMCGSPENWTAEAKKDAEIAKRIGATIRKVSFASIEGQDHCLHAVENHIQRMPFYTDGKNYASTLRSLIQAESEPNPSDSKPTRNSKSAKKRKKIAEEAENGAV